MCGFVSWRDEGPRSQFSRSRRYTLFLCGDDCNSNKSSVFAALSILLEVKQRLHEGLFEDFGQETPQIFGRVIGYRLFGVCPRHEIVRRTVNLRILNLKLAMHVERS